MLHKETERRIGTTRFVKREPVVQRGRLSDATERRNLRREDSAPRVAWPQCITHQRHGSCRLHRDYRYAKDDLKYPATGRNQSAW